MTPRWLEVSWIVGTDPRHAVAFWLAALALSALLLARCL